MFKIYCDWRVSINVCSVFTPFLLTHSSYVLDIVDAFIYVCKYAHILLAQNFGSYLFSWSLSDYKNPIPKEWEFFTFLFLWSINVFFFSYWEGCVASSDHQVNTLWKLCVSNANNGYGAFCLFCEKHCSWTTAESISCEHLCAVKPVILNQYS